jgi:hypothetical protein
LEQLMTTTELPGTVQRTPGQQPAAKPSPKRKRRPAAKKGGRRAGLAKRAPAKRPANLEDARREMLRLVCLNSVAITQAVIDDALAGKYLSARFLFELAGLCTAPGEESEDATKRESLASLLLQRFQLATPEGAEVTEAKVTPDMDAAAEAPVES